ncbi:SPFH domain-containing protein [Williamwhitmania taraxaci]|uniref:Membrane protease subunit, stomatin/prohibitin family, contains C-terminal Zn-ribbon domain n=1 Tax=Williamwhitmania taraxaci TaxID=1640674 RepID=A0A1G6QUS0_9BACT|nr:SPFH domain-containing protein [Williamwhitmania taraxaci]SDC95417.1 Membrane protease subunit, stomatin/prohibitin family, contains C-terminal Zn-ribbon domain [Williamwhitmania taraxaci]
MGLFNSLRGELIDIIEWLDDTNKTIVHRFERHDNEIKNNAKLIVRESQTAVFVDQGKFADVFLPGTYTLSTENLPILSTLKGWKYGFDSPFKSEVYFLNTKRFTDMGWGTPNPIIIRDPELGAIRVKAFGNYSFKVKDPKLFLGEISGTDGVFTIEKIEDQFRNFIVTEFSDFIAESKIPVIDFSSKYNEISAFCNAKIKPKFECYGIELIDLLVENISLPEELEAMLDKRSSMNIIGDLNSYTKFQTANAIEDAANNPSGGASEGMGMGMGFAMAQGMVQNVNQQANQENQNRQTPPPLSKQSNYYYAQSETQKGPVSLQDIENLINSGTVNKDTLVWKEGMADWMTAVKIQEIAGLFGSIPPLIPK